MPFSHFLGSPCSPFPHRTAFLQHQLWMLQLGWANPTGHSSLYTSRNTPRTLERNDRGAIQAGAKIPEKWQVFNANTAGGFLKKSWKVPILCWKGNRSQLAIFLPASFYWFQTPGQAGSGYFHYHVITPQYVSKFLSKHDFFFFQATFYHFFSIIMTDSESNLNWAWRRRHENNEVPSAQGRTSPSFIPEARPCFRADPLSAETRLESKTCTSLGTWDWK